jgi:CRP/FNR family cyclic AMP-dependent transcriptional regulator
MPKMAEQFLQRSRLCSGLAAEELTQVAEAVRRVSFRNGEAVCRQGDHGDTMYIVAQGRLKVTVSRGGEQRLVDFLTAGDHFGEMAMLSEGERTASVTAVTDTVLFELTTDDFHCLMADLPGFAANLGRTLCARLRRETSGRQVEKHVRRVAVVRTTRHCAELVPLLVDALAVYGKTTAILSDRDALPPAGERCRYESLSDSAHGPIGSGHVGSGPVDSGQVDSDQVGRLRQRGDQLIAGNDHLVLDVAANGVDLRFTELLADYDQVWVAVDAGVWEAVKQRLEELLARVPKLAPKVHLVWVLRDDERFAPHVQPPEDRHTRLQSRHQRRSQTGFHLPASRHHAVAAIHVRQTGWAGAEWWGSARLGSFGRATRVGS